MSLLRHPGFIIVLIVLVILLFGSNKLPDLARSVGQSLKILKKDVKDLRDDDPAESAQPGATTPPPPAGPDVAGSPDAAGPAQNPRSEDDGSPTA